MTALHLFLLYVAFACFCTAAFLWMCIHAPLQLQDGDLEQLARDWEDEVGAAGPHHRDEQGLGEAQPAEGTRGHP